MRELDVLLYSGYALSRIRRGYADLLELVDAVMSGPYIAARPTNLPWRGSANQQLSLLTQRARERYDYEGSFGRLQVGVEGGQIWITGIPTSDDLELLEERLGDRGVRLEDVSWRS
jgi:anaerobic ribonucleoside-triphosphate reductase activating protein